jgi:diguanylate cyclase (GGDEF)-like protein
MSSRGVTAPEQPSPDAPQTDAPARRGRAISTRLRSLTSVNTVWWLSALMAVTATVMFFGVVRDFGALAGPHIPWWVLAPGFFLAERCVVHLHFRRSAHSFSLGDIPLVLGLVFSDSWELILAGLIGNALTLCLDRRLPPIKLAFNLTQFALATCLATMVVHELVPFPHGLDDPWLWTAVLVATEVSALFTVLLIGVAISLSEGPIKPITLGQMFVMDFVVTMTNTSLALAASIVLSFDPRALPLLAVPGITVFLAYRAYILERQRHERLEFLYEATRTLSRSPEIVLALEGLLERSLEAFRAELAEIILFNSDGGPPLRTTLGPGGFKEVMVPVDEGVAADLRGLVEGERPAVRLSRPFGSERLRRYLDARRVTEAMLSVMPGETRVIGTIMLANRFGVIRSFSDDDLKLFEALANNASVALQYDRLEQAVLQLRELQEQLHHQAFHDPLTDLANRSLFINRVKDALTAGTGEIAVLFIDLDDFKTFNDSLGHAAGDELLVAVAERLRLSVRPSDAIARLGGDEFAVLVQDQRGVRNSATAVAARILDSFREPVQAADELISVHLSIGIATSDESRKADALIRNADLAMYKAKETGKGRYEVFQSSMRDAVVKRHGLKEELQQAVESGQLLVEYQPIVNLATGTVTSAEALVRWNHPGRGRLLPAEFVPIAEETGLIVAVGQHVLERSCQEASRWQHTMPTEEGIAVHVNLSAVELRDPGLTASVASALDDAGLDPGLLVLEMTESLVQDADACAPTLTALRATGVRLALDDFGTGYSSLSYLRSLPLDILKIAKPFVEGMARGRQENSFVRMIIDLARALDLQVVAEGIESAEELEALRDLGCELGQGFYLAEPIAATTGQLPLANTAHAGVKSQV